MVTSVDEIDAAVWVVVSQATLKLSYFFDSREKCKLLLATATLDILLLRKENKISRTTQGFNEPSNQEK